LGSIRIESGSRDSTPPPKSPDPKEPRRDVVCVRRASVLSGVCDEIPVNRRAKPDWHRRRPT
jgi:hypothetical protein